MMDGDGRDDRLPPEDMLPPEGTVPPEDAAPPEDALPPEPAPAAQRLRRFCKRCGAALDRIGGVCTACVPPPRPEHARHPNPLAAPLGLYALLLLTFVPLLLSDEIGLVLVVDVVDALIVAGFCLAAWSHMRPLLRLPRDPVWFFVAAGLVAITFPIASLAVDAMQGLLGMPAEGYSPPYLEAGYGWPVVILSVCVQPAIVEELAFRGIIFDGMRQVLSRNETVVVSSLMFAVLHLTPLGFPHLFAIGVALAWLRIRSGSLWPCMLLHFGHNLVCVLTE